MLKLFIDTLLFRKRCRNCHWFSPVSRTCMRNAFNSKRDTVYHPDCRGCRNHSWIWSWEFFDRAVIALPELGWFDPDEG